MRRSEILVAGPIPPGALADFVSGTDGAGTVRVRVLCSTRTDTFTLSADLTRLTIESS